MTVGQDKGTSGDGDALAQAAQGGQLPGTDDSDEAFEGVSDGNRPDSAGDDAAASGGDAGRDGDNTPADEFGGHLLGGDVDEQG